MTLHRVYISKGAGLFCIVLSQDLRNDRRYHVCYEKFMLVLASFLQKLVRAEEVAARC
jgi:hypothetical protein